MQGSKLCIPEMLWGTNPENFRPFTSGGSEQYNFPLCQAGSDCGLWFCHWCWCLAAWATHWSLQCRPYRASLHPEPPGCMLPAGCWLAAAGTCQRGGHPQTPRNRRHSQLKRCPRCTSAKKQPSVALTAFPPESSHGHRVVILHLRAEGNLLTRRFELQGSLEAQAPSAACCRVWPGPGEGRALTGFSLQSSLSISGAIQPSVPGTPERRLKLCLPTASFLHSPKSEIMALTFPWALGIEMRMLWGFRSLWTVTNTHLSTQAVPTIVVNF